MMRYFRDRYLSEMRGCTVLDVGARSSKRQRTYRRLFSGYSYFGMDVIPGRNVDIVGFENVAGVFDVVISGQAMEHVRRPWEWLTRLRTYFSTFICIIAPNTWKEHRHPIDTYRYFPDGMRDLFDYAGIVAVEIRRSGQDTLGVGTQPRQAPIDAGVDSE